MKSKYLFITSSTRHETIFCLVIYIYLSTFALRIDFGTIARFFILIRIFDIQHYNCNILGIWWEAWAMARPNYGCLGHWGFIIAKSLLPLLANPRSWNRCFWTCVASPSTNVGMGRSLPCQVENHMQTKKRKTFSKLHHQSGSQMYQFVFAWIDIHDIYYIVKMIIKFDIFSRKIIVSN